MKRDERSLPLRVLVVSDTHGDRSSLMKAIISQPSAEAVIHLGDGADEAEEMKAEFPGKDFFIVRGNNDWGSSLPRENEITLADRKIFYTHGNIYNVRYGLYDITEEAKKRGADIVLFGHTHKHLTEYRDGLYIMNPGSLLGGHGTYGTIDITKAGIVLNIVKMN